MLHLYSKRNIPNTKELIRVPWMRYFFEEQVPNYFDKTDEKIINDIEKTSLVDNYTMHGKFSGTHISTGLLSEGCKTLLCINHAIKTNTIDKYIFDITSCGPNAIEYLASNLAQNIDIEAYCRHSQFGTKKCDIKIDNKSFSSLLRACIKYTDILEEEVWRG